MTNTLKHPRRPVSSAVMVDLTPCPGRLFKVDITLVSMGGWGPRINDLKMNKAQVSLYLTKTNNLVVQTGRPRFLFVLGVWKGTHVRGACPRVSPLSTSWSARPCCRLLIAWPMDEQLGNQMVHSESGPARSPHARIVCSQFEGPSCQHVVWKTRSAFPE